MVPVSAAQRSMMSNKYDEKLAWNFSATSNSKTPVDGVGATLKRHAMK